MKEIANLFYSLEYKSRVYLVVILAMSVLLQMAAVSGSDDNTISEADLTLPAYGEDDVVLPVNVEVEGGVSFDTDISLEARTYTSSEAYDYFQKVKECLADRILGNNTDTDSISGNLNLVERVDDIPVDISWYSSDCELVASDGRIYNTDWDQDERVGVTLYAMLSCCEFSMEVPIEITVVAPHMTKQEQLVVRIKKYIKEAVNESEDGSVVLPDSFDGMKLSYTKPQTQTSYSFIVLGIVAAAVVIYGEKKNVITRQKKRMEQMRYDYSEVVLKITLLIGAGMPMRQAWERMVADYRKKKDDRIHYVYEEMATACNQLKAGVPESEVYETFGKRCELKEYQKLSTLMVQNLTKGTKDLRKLLELESIEAFENRKNMARVKGEEAGTKLLIPMIMMLVTIMIMVMVPALMTIEM